MSVFRRLFHHFTKYKIAKLCIFAPTMRYAPNITATLPQLYPNFASTTFAISKHFVFNLPHLCPVQLCPMSHLCLFSWVLPQLCFDRLPICPILINLQITNKTANFETKRLSWIYIILQVSLTRFEWPKLTLLTKTSLSNILYFPFLLIKKIICDFVD